MNLTKQQVKEHLFEEVEYGNCSWRKGELQGYFDGKMPYLVNGDFWDNCRLPQPKAKRLLTIKELWGKTLIHDTYGMLIVADSDSKGRILIRTESVDSQWLNIEELNKLGWRLADETLDYENATSLKVEVITAYEVSI